MRGDENAGDCPASPREPVSPVPCPSRPRQAESLGGPVASAAAAGLNSCCPRTQNNRLPRPQNCRAALHPRTARRPTMLKFGMNTAACGRSTLNDSILPVCEKLKHMGFDGHRSPHLRLRREEVRAARQTARRSGPGPDRRHLPRCRRQSDRPDPKVRALGVANTCRTHRLLPALGVDGAGRSLPFGHGPVQRQGPHGRRMEVGRRRDAASGRTCRQGQGHAGDRILEPFRDATCSTPRPTRPATSAKSSIPTAA